MGEEVGKHDFRKRQNRGKKASGGNREFTEQIMGMFREAAKRDGETLNRFCQAIEKGDAGEVERLFTAYLKKTISIRDTFACYKKTSWR